MDAYHVVVVRDDEVHVHEMDDVVVHEEAHEEVRDEMVHDVVLHVVVVVLHQHLHVVVVPKIHDVPYHNDVHPTSFHVNHAYDHVVNFCRV
jgi:hypothetical protein